MKEIFLHDLHDVPQIRPFQVEGIKFLLKQFRTNTGAILNDGPKLGKKTQTILFLKSLIANEPQTKVLIITDNFNSWNRLFKTWSPLITLNQNVLISDCSKTEEFVIKPWDILILDNLQIKTIKQLNNIKCNFKIWLSSENLLPNIIGLYKILNFVTKDSIGKLKEFESAFTCNSFDKINLLRKRQLLDEFTRRWLLRRTVHILEDQLPFEPIETNENQNSTPRKSKIREKSKEPENPAPSLENNSDSLILIEQDEDVLMNIEDDSNSPSILSPVKKCLKRSHSSSDDNSFHLFLEPNSEEENEKEVEKSSPAKKGHFLNVLFDDDDEDSEKIDIQPKSMEIDEESPKDQQKKFKLLDDILFN